MKKNIKRVAILAATSGALIGLAATNAFAGRTWV